VSDLADNRRTWGRIGGLTAWSRNDRATMVGPAHRGFKARFENIVIAAAAERGETLTAQELAIRADRSRRAYMLSLAAKSAAARRKPAADEATGEGRR
jgi:hypothetical protein